MAAATEADGTLTLSFVSLLSVCKKKRKMLRSSLVRTIRSASAVMPARAQAVSVGSVSASGPVAFENLEARWPSLSDAERMAVSEKIVDAMKGDWKALTLEEKRAALYLAFGSTKPEPSDAPQVFLGSVGLITVSLFLAYYIKSLGKETPRTMTKDWQEATNEKMLRQKANPLHGISSPGYKGPGFVQ